MLDASKLRALAADLEDVVLRWHGSSEDMETVRDVADELLTGADGHIEVRDFINAVAAGRLDADLTICIRAARLAIITSPERKRL